jgi:hypothetical protein
MSARPSGKAGRVLTIKRAANHLKEERRDRRHRTPTSLWTPGWWRRWAPPNAAGKPPPIATFRVTKKPVVQLRRDCRKRRLLPLRGGAGTGESAGSCKMGSGASPGFTAGESS